MNEMPDSDHQISVSFHDSIAEIGAADWDICACPEAAASLVLKIEARWRVAAAALAEFALQAISPARSALSLGRCYAVENILPNADGLERLVIGEG